MNGWLVGFGGTQLFIDYVKFGYPVAAVKSSSNIYTSAAIVNGYTNDNIAINFTKPRNTSVTVSYDIWSPVDYTTGMNPEIIGTKRVWKYLFDIKKDKWTTVSHVIPKEDIMYSFAIGTPITYDEIGHLVPPYECTYFKNIMISYGSETVPWVNNPILPKSLNEQIVPNEFFNDDQVYVKTFRGLFPEAISTADNYITLIGSTSQLVWAEGWTIDRDNTYNMLLDFIQPRMNVEISKEYLHSVHWAGGNILFSYFHTNMFRGGWYEVTIKYTK